MSKTRRLCYPKGVEKGKVRNGRALDSECNDNATIQQETPLRMESERRVTASENRYIREALQSMVGL